MTRGVALYEAARCLGCHEAPCTSRCPVKIPVYEFIASILSTNFGRAADLVYRANPLALTCGISCPSWKYCESGCTLRKLGQEPVRIRALHRFAAGQEHRTPVFPAIANRSLPVAVVGAGPAGLACAQALRMSGIAVTIFEREDRIGGNAAAHFPERRELQAALYEDAKGLLEDDHVDIQLSTEVGYRFLQEIRREFAAVCVATGRPVWRSGQEPYHGQTMTGGPKDLLQALYNRRSPLPPDIVVEGNGRAPLTIAMAATGAGVGRVRLVTSGDATVSRPWHRDLREAMERGVEVIRHTRVRAYQVLPDASYVLEAHDAANGETRQMITAAFASVTAREREPWVDAVEEKAGNLYVAGEASTAETTLTAAVMGGLRTGRSIAANIADRRNRGDA